MSWNSYWVGLVVMLAFGSGCNCGPQSVDGDAGVDGGLCVKASNRALRFSGTQYLVAVDSSTLHLSDLTVEAWVSFGGVSSPGYNTIVGKPYGTRTADSFTVWYEAGGLRAGANPTSPSDAIGKAWVPTLGQWYHVAFTYEHATRAQRLYLDGALFASGTAESDPLYDAHPFFIGGDVDFGSPSGFFKGDIDEVRIWTSVRAIEEIGGDLRSCAPGSFDGLAAYFPLDEGAGQAAGDVSGNGNTAQLGESAGPESSDPTWVDSGVPF